MKAQAAKRILAAVLVICTLLTVLVIPTNAASGWVPTESNTTVNGSITAYATRLYVCTERITQEGVVNMQIISGADRSAVENSTTLTDEEKAAALKALRDEAYAPLKDLDSNLLLFAAEYKSKLGKTLKYECGPLAKAGTNDIVFQLDETLDISSVGFQVTKSGNRLNVKVKTGEGAFYAARYILQQLLTDGAVADMTVTAPVVDERSVSLDCGRKYYTPDWIKQLIREMSWSGMNTLVLHFSEDMGLGLESKTFPWLAGRDGALCSQSIKIQNVVNDTTNPDRAQYLAYQQALSSVDTSYLTQEELADIVAYARLYNIDIIPSLDTPGHMDYVVKQFNDKAATAEGFTFAVDGVEYKVASNSYSTRPVGATDAQWTKVGSCGLFGISNYFQKGSSTPVLVSSSGNTSTSRGIDLSNDLAVAFAKCLFTEYATLFYDLGSTKIDLGGDELLGWGLVNGYNRWESLDHWKAEAQAVTGNTNAVAYDLFLLYMNDLNQRALDIGYASARMWNDDVLRTKDTGWQHAVELDTRIHIWYWTDTANGSQNTVSTYIDAGYQVYNLLNEYNYYALLPTPSYTNATAKNLINIWNPYYFGREILTGDDRNAVLGGAYAIWCDLPVVATEAEVMADILPCIRANAATCWGTTMSYSAFDAYWKKVGDAPVVDTVHLPHVLPNVIELEELIVEYYAKYLPNIEDYVPAHFENYSQIVTEADINYEGGLAKRYTQAGVDTMVSTIKTARNCMIPSKLIRELTERIDLYYTYYLPRQKGQIAGEEPYAIDPFCRLATVVLRAEQYVATGNFTEDQLNECLFYYDLYSNRLLANYVVLKPESEYEYSHERVKGFVNAKFVSNYTFVGKTTHLTVNTVRSANVLLPRVCILDENLKPVEFPVTITEAPLNIRQRTVRTYKIAFEFDLDPGTYTFRIYGETARDTSNGGPETIMTKDYVDVTIEIR